MATKKKNRRRNRIITLILILVLLAGLAVLLYPSVAAWWNSRVQSRAVASYDQAVAGLTDENYAEILKQAEAYNQALYALGSATALAVPDKIDGYWDTLDLTGTGILGYVTIEKIKVQLPIYHGTSSAVLSAGAGHIQGSSLPVGGENTHSVISAHRGLPSSTLFTHLDQLEIGDTFTITVLDQVYTYQVDQISIVLPDEIEDLYIEAGQDCCTLMTCTPYGINTHRLLVRGTRIETGSHIRVSGDATKLKAILVAPFLAVPLAIIVMILLLCSGRRRRRRGQRKHTP